MKRFSFLLVLFGLSNFGATLHAPAPTFDVRALDGTTVRSSALQGRVVVVDFMASWCEPCRQTLPRIDALARAHNARGLSVIGICVDENRAACEQLVRTTNVRFPVVHDAEQHLAEQWNPSAMPSTFVIGRNGTVRFIFSGQQAEAVERAVATALEER